MTSKIFVSAVAVLATVSAMGCTVDTAEPAVEHTATSRAALDAQPTSIRSMMGLCLDVQNGSTAWQTPVWTWGCHGGPAQQWTFTPAGEIRGLGDLCLDVQNGSTVPGTPVWMYPCTGNAAQKWSLRPDGSLQGLGSLCLEVPGASRDAGTLVDVTTCNGGPNQRWFIDPMTSYFSDYDYGTTNLPSSDTHFCVLQSVTGNYKSTFDQVSIAVEADHHWHGRAQSTSGDPAIWTSSQVAGTARCIPWTLFQGRGAPYVAPSVGTVDADARRVCTYPAPYFWDVTCDYVDGPLTAPWHPLPQPRNNTLAWSDTFCAIQGMSGTFRGASEHVWVTQPPATGGYWMLHATTDWEEDDVTDAIGSSSCVSFGTGHVRYLGDEFTWDQTQLGTTPMIPINQGFCFFTGVAGEFRGGGERAEIVANWSTGMWELDGQSMRDGVSSRARCVAYDQR